MVHDPAARLHQAVHAATLTKIGETVDAIGMALAYCHHAGIDADTDPAVILSARSLGQFAEAGYSTNLLRRLCSSRILDLRAIPALSLPQPRPIRTQ